MCYKSYPSRSGAACETNVLHVRIQFYGQGYFTTTYNNVYPCYGALRAQCVHYSCDVTIGVGKLSEPLYIIAHVRTTSHMLSIDRLSTGLSRDVTAVIV